MAREKAPQMQIEYWDIERLTPYARNPRKNDAAVPKMAGLIREFGFKVPVIVRSSGEVIDGHLRLKAAWSLGMTQIPVVIADEWSEAQVKAFRLAVNKSAEWAEWDNDLLKLELEDLKLEDFDLDIIDFAGFEEEDLSPVEDDTDDKYTTKTDIPQYEPTGKHVTFSECADTDKYTELLDEIEHSSCSDDVKSFLRIAATRHIAFSYKNIAEYYANDADEATQALFEKMALVIIDYNDAMKNGYVKVSKELEKITGAGHDK